MKRKQSISWCIYTLWSEWFKGVINWLHIKPDSSTQGISERLDIAAHQQQEHTRTFFSLNLLFLWVWLIVLMAFLHAAARACACVCFLNPVFKISPAFGFMPVALGIVLCFCFVLTSTCLDSFHASHSLLSTKLPVQDSPLNLKRRWASGAWKWKQHPKSWKKKKEQTSNCLDRSL